MTRKLIAMLLVAAAILTMLPMSALAYDSGAAAETTAASSGTWGSLTWTLSSSGTLTVTGTGAMKETSTLTGTGAVRKYTGSGTDFPWLEYKTQIKKVVISNGITTIADGAFMCCPNLTSITIPNSVTSIGGGAFRQCPLTSVSIGNGVKEFGFKPFCMDPWAEDQAAAQGDLLIINHVVVDTGYQNGPDLETISVPSGVTGISEEAFAECISLKELILPDTLTSLSENAIINGDYFSLTTLTIPASVKSIGEHAFGFTRTSEYGADGENTVQYVYSVDPNFTARVYAGSTAETWCKKNGVAYTVIGSSGWQQSGSSWYYYENGRAVTGWKQISGKWYYFNASGVMQSGWQKISGKWYYLKNYMLTGWQKIDGKWYYLNTAMQTGWQKIDGKWYYLNTSMQTGWQKIDGKWYYLNTAMQTGWQKIGGKWYYLNNAMVTGWQKINGTWYYFGTNGAMVSGCTMTIDGKSYTFNANGAWIG